MGSRGVDRTENRLRATDVAGLGHAYRDFCGVKPRHDRGRGTMDQGHGATEQGAIMRKLFGGHGKHFFAQAELDCSTVEVSLSPATIQPSGGELLSC